jgi:hypothetical protein
MSGVVVLQGGGPFEANDELDRRVFDGCDSVVVMPTADAFEQPQALIDSARVWGDRIGVGIEPLMVLTRPDATAAAAAVIDAASAVMLVGDSANHLRSVVKGTPVFDALERLVARGGTLVATGASASAVCDPMTDRRGGGYAFGLGLVAGMAVVTETEIWPSDQLQRAHELATTPIIDLPTGSAAIRSDGAWELVGDAVARGDLPS